MERSQLHNYQTFAIDHILDNKYCGLLLDMGLGKTVSTLTALDTLLYEELEIGRVLVVAPKRVIETVWKEEADKWSHLHRLKISKIVGNEKQRLEAIKVKADIYLISRDNFAWLVDLFNSHKLFFDMLVLDELSSFKSNKSQRFKAARIIRPLMKRVIGLTGTPSSNGLMDLWAQMYLLDRGERLEKTVTNYRNMYFRPGRTNGHIVFNYDLIPGCDKIIYSKIEDICISMKAIDHIQMPERIDNFIEVFMPDKIKKQYDDFEKSSVLEMASLIESEDNLEIPVVNAAALSNKLLQFANGAVYDENRGIHVVHDLKIEALLEIIDDANGQPVLVAWSYRHDLSRLKVALEKYKPRELSTAQDIIDWNNGKILVMLAHPASAGHGINLQGGGNIIIWFGLCWSLELYMQFNSRILRQGQMHSSVIINHLVLKGSHDEDVIKSLRSKDRKQESLLAAVKAKIQQYIQLIHSTHGCDNS
jgi:SNF2 family DNA or RNA helicase